MSNATGACPVCGTPLPPRKPGPGRHRIYCSTACGQTARKTTSQHERPKAVDWTPPKTHTCETCGAQYAPNKQTQRYCSAPCAHRARRSPDTQDRSCETCGTLYRPSARESRYCSRDCHNLHRMENAGHCTIDGCTRPHRARGLCGSHYNQQHQPDRHSKTPRPCTVCGELTNRREGAARRPVCSYSCRYALTWGHATPEARRLAALAPHAQLVGPVRFEKPTQAPTTVLPSTFTRLVSGRCRMCGQWFTDYPAGKTRRITVCCSDTCTRRWARRRHYVTDEVRQGIYQRDNWTCQLCLTTVDATLPPHHTWAATLDHITPRAHGGTHEPENLRLTHRYCNSIRSDAQLPDAWFISPGA